MHVEGMTSDIMKDATMDATMEEDDMFASAMNGGGDESAPPQEEDDAEGDDGSAQFVNDDKTSYTKEDNATNATKDKENNITDSTNGTNGTDDSDELLKVDPVLAQCLKELDDIRMAEYALSRAEHMLLVSNTNIDTNDTNDNDDDAAIENDGRLARLRHAGLGSALDDAADLLRLANSTPLSSVPMSWSDAFIKAEEQTKKTIVVETN